MAIASVQESGSNGQTPGKITTIASKRTTMEVGDCPFRYDTRNETACETAQCRLLDQLTISSVDATIRVPRGACEACVRRPVEELILDHPVFPSLLYQRCESLLDSPQFANQMAANDLNRLKGRRASAEAAVFAQCDPSKPIHFLPSCDVILVANESTPLLIPSIESLCDQIDVAPFIHLVDTGTAAESFDAFSGRWNIERHRMPQGTTAFEALHSIIESLKTPYVAFQSAYGVSEPHRLSVSVRALVDRGAEMFATPCSGETEFPVPTDSDRGSVRKFGPSTVVMRRATFVDMGGVADNLAEDDFEFFHRVVHEERRIVVGETSLVQLLAPGIASVLRRPPNYPATRGGTLKSLARGFPRVPAACDVVLPFFGHLDYAEESLQGLLDQADAELVIHLIDDATPGDTTSFLQRWSGHPNIRTYRNRENIGQFQSFNSVSRFFETELAAVQDADDISLPHRLSWAGQMLRYSGADFFGGAVELFGDSQNVISDGEGRKTMPSISQGPIRRSVYPAKSRDYYFAENPTAVFRVSTFRELGGFADFGDRLQNRASLDTEFQSRARFHGVRFALSRDIGVLYRVHPQSATQDNVTGWGTAPRTSAGRQFVERCKIFERGPFDPRSFGSLDSIPAVTMRFR